MINYYEDSFIKESEGNLIGGKKEGEWIYYYVTGDICREEFYIDGKKKTLILDLDETLIHAASENEKIGRSHVMIKAYCDEIGTHLVKLQIRII